MHWIILAAILVVCFTEIQAAVVEWESSKDKINYHILKANISSDPFNQLSEEELLKEWSFEEKDGLLEKIEILKHSFEEQIYIDVKLIGLTSIGSDVEVQIMSNN